MGQLMRTFGLIGYPLSHSFSQKYFTEKFKKENLSDCEFKNFSLEDINDFPALLKNNPGLYGLSVTIPHKQTVLPYLHELDTSAKEIGAINCIRLSPVPIATGTPLPVLGGERETKEVRCIGYNTDVIGFAQSLKPLLKAHHTNALILGTGGASKAVAFVLKKMEIEFSFVSRKQKKASSIKCINYQRLNKELISAHPVIINTTPLGTFPNIHDYPNIPYEHLSSGHLLYDLTYNPEESAFLKKGKAHGAQIKNGLEMLHLQAEKAWEIWNEPFALGI